jgi:hypothetical protein
MIETRSFPTQDFQYLIDRGGYRRKIETISLTTEIFESRLE